MMKLHVFRWYKQCDAQRTRSEKYQCESKTVEKNSFTLTMSILVVPTIFEENDGLFVLGLVFSPDKFHLFNGEFLTIF